MEIVTAADAPKPHRLLRWAGLQGPAPSDESWVPVAARFMPDMSNHRSGVAELLVEKLAAAGVEARQAPYEASASAGGIAIGASMANKAPRVAVLVQKHDRERAMPVVVEMKAALDRQLEEAGEPSPVSDEELTRMALAAADPEDDD
jgi:hypothetical protein